MRTLFLMVGGREFFAGLWDKYVLDLQDFLHEKLERLVGVALLCWLLMWLLALTSRHILRLAERQANTTGRYSQVRTMTSVIRATGLGVIVLADPADPVGLRVQPGAAADQRGRGGRGDRAGGAEHREGLLQRLSDPDRGPVQRGRRGDGCRRQRHGGNDDAAADADTGRRWDAVHRSQLQITTVANLVRDYSLATINVSVDFSANPDAVMQVLKDAAMSVRNDPTYSNVYLADPVLLGVDAIKGSQVIYPVQLKTKANQQWAAQRETQRRIRLALEKHGMLPGDPIAGVLQRQRTELRAGSSRRVRAGGEGGSNDDQAG